LATALSAQPGPWLSGSESVSQSNSGIANSRKTGSGTAPDSDSLADNAGSAALSGPQIKAAGFAGGYLLRMSSTGGFVPEC
jgi:hypothetical protein